MNQTGGITDALGGDFTGSVRIGLLGWRCACWSFLWFTIPNPLGCVLLRAELPSLLYPAEGKAADGAVPSARRAPCSSSGCCPNTCLKTGFSRGALCSAVPVVLVPYPQVPLSQWNIQECLNILDALCNTFFERQSSIFFLQPSTPWLGGGKFIRLEFLSIVSFPACALRGWMSAMVLPGFFLPGLKMPFPHTSSGRAACWSGMVSLSVCISVLAIGSDQEPTDSMGHWRRDVVSWDLCYLALQQKVAAVSLPGQSGWRCSDHIWRLYFRSSSLVLLCYILGIVRYYGNFQIFSCCKVRYLT